MLAGRTVRGVLRDPETKPSRGRIEPRAIPSAIPLLVMLKPEDEQLAGSRMHLPMQTTDDGTLVLELPSVPLVMEVIARPHYTPRAHRSGPNRESFDVSLVRGAIPWSC